MHTAVLAGWSGSSDTVAAGAQGHKAEIQAMYQEWPFFQSTVDLIEMVRACAASPASTTACEHAL